MKVKLTKTEYNQMRKRLISLKESKTEEDINLLEKLKVQAEDYAKKADYTIEEDLLIMWFLHLSIMYTPFLLEQICLFHEKAQAN